MLTKKQIASLLNENESEWLERKKDNSDPEMLGRNISALANAACLHGMPSAYLIFGQKDDSTIIGTSYNPKKETKGSEELIHWLSKRLSPSVHFTIHCQDYEGKPIVIFDIPAANAEPVKFTNIAYIRIGSSTKILSAYPDKEKIIWHKGKKFETGIAKSNLTKSDILILLNFQKYFELLKLPVPDDSQNIIDRFLKENFIVSEKGEFNITNLGAILLAKDLNDFEPLARKAIRVIIYKDKTKVHSIKEMEFIQGYATYFDEIVDYIQDKLPSSEEIDVFRTTKYVYPKLAIRELLANAMIHQDFSESGSSVMVEIFKNRIEFTNPGKPLINALRFADENLARNDKLANVMRRMAICEERGSGIDKVLEECELYQLPAPFFLEQTRHTKVILSEPKTLNDMTLEERIAACYWHACLKYLAHDKLTNTTLRHRLKIDQRNASKASRIINATLEEGLIKPQRQDINNKKYIGYIPAWG